MKKSGIFGKITQGKAKNTLDIVDVLIDCHLDEVTIASAMLQGVLQVDLTTIEEIEDVFGKDIARIVEGVRNVSRVQYKEHMTDRDIEALQRMLFVMAGDLRVIIIVLAKRLNEMQKMTDCLDNSHYKTAKETFEVYVPLADLLGIWKIKANLEDLCFQCLVPDEYKILNQQLIEHAKMGEKFINKMIDNVVAECKKEGIEIKTEGRMKHLYGIYQKMLRDKKNIGEVYDIYALRLIADDNPTCYRILGIIHNMYPPKRGRFKDYIAAPKPNHYQSLHTTVVGEGNTVVEFQIRTESMHYESQFGVASHFLYKTNDEIAPWMKDILHLLKKYHDKKTAFEDLRAVALRERILVFTNEGNIVDLPENSTVLDFAYLLGPQYGHCFKSATVNGKKASVNTALHTGDKVKIITDTYSHPKRDWLNVVNTDLARKYLINFFRQESREKKLLLGMQILERELQMAGQKSIEHLTRREKRKLCSELDYATLDDMYVAIGEGILHTESVIYRLYPKKRMMTMALSMKIQKWWNTLWGNNKIKDAYPVTLKVISEDRFGLLKDVISVFTKLKKNIVSVHSKRNFLLHHLYSNKFTVNVKDFDELHQIVSEIEKVENVRKVMRCFSRNKIIFYILSFVTVAFWISHPIIVAYTETGAIAPMVAHIYLVLCIILLFALIYVLKVVINKQIILLEEARYNWLIIFVLNTIALFTIVGEYLFMQTHLNWILILGILMAVYAELTFDYIRIQRYFIKT